MNTQPTAAHAVESRDVCMGVMCSRHAHCAAYANVEGADPEQPRIGTCRKGDDFPKFVQLSLRRVAK